MVRSKKTVEWSKYLGVAISGVAVGAALLGVPKCSEMQTVATAASQHDVLEKQIELERSRQYEEHKDFRRAIKENSDNIAKNMEKILELLLQK